MAGEADVEAAALFRLPSTGQAVHILPGSFREVEFIYREIFEDGVYSKHFVAVQPGHVVVDVGANIGLFCYHAALQAGAVSEAAPMTYYGVEALPPTFEVLQRNIASMKKGFSGMIVKALLNVALGDQARPSVPFTMFPRLPGNSTLNPAEKMKMAEGILEAHVFEGATEYEVPMRTLSDMIVEQEIERIDYLKVDAEGAELMVLKGIKEEHWSRIWQVVVEVSDADEETNEGGKVEQVKRVHVINALLQKHGFEVKVELVSDINIHMVYAWRPSSS